MAGYVKYSKVNETVMSNHAGGFSPCLHMVSKCILGDRAANRQPRHMVVYTRVSHDQLRSVCVTTASE